MRTIHKFDMTQDVMRLPLPMNAQPLKVQLQYGVPRMWVLLDTSEKVVERLFIMAGTGISIDTDHRLNFVDTFQANGGQYVFHVFEVIGADQKNLN